jgi:hypothetical protein
VLKIWDPATLTRPPACAFQLPVEALVSAHPTLEACSAAGPQVSADTNPCFPEQSVFATVNGVHPHAEVAISRASNSSEYTAENWTQDFSLQQQTGVGFVGPRADRAANVRSMFVIANGCDPRRREQLRGTTVIGCCLSSFRMLVLYIPPAITAFSAALPTTNSKPSSADSAAKLPSDFPSHGTLIGVSGVGPSVPAIHPEGIPPLRV